MKYTKLFGVSLLAASLLGCNSDPAELAPDEKPYVGIAYIDGPLIDSNTGAFVDGINARNRPSGTLRVAAAEQYDPVSNTTTANPISVYVTASDERLVSSVELLLDGVSMGKYEQGNESQEFKNPFIFPPPGDTRIGVPIEGSQSGLTNSQLEAIVEDDAGQVSDEFIMNIRADGSRPDLNFSIEGSGPPYSGTVVLRGNAVDPESGVFVESFGASLNGEEIEIDSETPNSFALSIDTTSLDSGPQSVKLGAINGVYVPNEATFSFEVNQKTIAQDDEVSTQPDETATINVLGNDTDAEEDAATITAVTEPVQGGEAEIVGDIFISYTPPAGFTGTDGFSYTITDSFGRQSSASVIVTVGEEEENPEE